MAHVDRARPQQIPPQHPSQQLFKHSMTYQHGPQGSEVQFHSVTLGCIKYAADAGFGGLHRPCFLPRAFRLPGKLCLPLLLFMG